MKFKNYTIPEGTEVEIVNKNSRFFRRRGKLEAEEPGDLGCNVWFEDDEYDVFCYYEFLPVQNIITLDKLEAKKLVQIFDANYLYETNRVVVYIIIFNQRMAGYLMLKCYVLLDMRPDIKSASCKNIFLFRDTPQIRQSMSDYIKQ